MSLAALLSAIFGVMLEPLQQEFGWSRAEISSGPAIVSMMGLFLATPAGYLIDRYGARRCGILVVLVSCSSIASMGAIGSELWHWWAAWSLFGVAGAFTSTVWMAPVSTIFVAGRGLAIAVTISGTGISTALAPAIAEYFVQNQGWRMGFVALAVLWLAVTFPLVLTFVPRRLAVSSSNGKAGSERPLTGLTPRQGFRSPTLYVLFFASLLSAVTGIAIVLNLVPVLTSTGLERAEAIAIIGTMGLVSIVGRIAGGVLLDRFDARTIAIVASLVSLGLPLSLLLFPGNATAALVGVIAYGATGGVKMNAIVYLISVRLGARSFGLFYSLISISLSVAQGLGPLIANHIYDLSGSYTPVLWAAIPAFTASALLFVALGRDPGGAGTEQVAPG
ncbi:MFS transporter [Novosphingobium sp. M1R2S20]|uniref:MFS transporter n=1 Tax=Novosphingobium rhizovicinum TaxID=3228928 RepID=A0ABV3RF26_9SPHN